MHNELLAYLVTVDKVS